MRGADQRRHITALDERIELSLGDRPGHRSDKDLAKALMPTQLDTDDSELPRLAHTGMRTVHRGWLGCCGVGGGGGGGGVFFVIGGVGGRGGVDVKQNPQQIKKK